MRTYNYKNIILFLLLSGIFIYHFNIWCNEQIIEGIQNQNSGQYQQYSNNDLGAKVQKNAGNIQYLKEHTANVPEMQSSIKSIQKNVDKLNQQMTAIQQQQTAKAKAQQKQAASAKKVTGLN